ncbi:MAG: tRNA (adenosine(37)-N6)-dimethylallyltransferase MiaA [candidate division Zixibacteria bacterium]|nr:tRNA (adenosine(37)-N6)-dimethylallyltransferase MiaA [candidate division Zixibacteria bacterium]
MAETSPIPIICGPTGSGKTAAALELAGRFPYEIVNADSRQIIRHLEIGTAKPTAEERSRAVFHLLDLIEPGEAYSAVRYVTDATRVIKDIIKRGNRPLIVGGTGLYLRALSEGIVQIESDDMTIRERLEAEMTSVGSEPLWERLNQIDPLEAAKVHPNNKVRIIRALEIYQLTGKTKSELMASGGYQSSGFQFTYYCLQPERGLLYRGIEARVDQMIEN